MPNIKITCPTSDALIYYTTDGFDPNPTSNLYSGNFNISESCTIKAIGIKEGYLNSDISSLDVEVIKLVLDINDLVSGHWCQFHIRDTEGNPIVLNNVEVTFNYKSDYSSLEEAQAATKEDLTTTRISPITTDSNGYCHGSPDSTIDGNIGDYVSAYIHIDGYEDSDITTYTQPIGSGNGGGIG